MAKTVPKYEAVTSSLRELAATLKPGDSFPSHSEVARRFGVSSGTALRALEILRHDGRIARRNGVGTFVAEPPKSSAPPPRLLPAMMTDRRTVAGIMMPDSSYFAYCMSRLYHRVEANGLALACRVMDPAGVGDFVAPSRDEDRPLGFILFDWKKIAPLARQLQEAGNRVVVIGAPPQGIASDVPCVYGDDEHGSYLLARHLFDLGHRRIATTSFFEWTLRWHGYQRAVREATRTYGEGIRGTRIAYHEFQGWFREPAQAAAFLQLPDAPTAILCWNDDEAARMIAALTHAHLRVPEDISVVGYDNLPASLRVYPHLTTVDQGIDGQLRTALDLLLRDEPPLASHSVMVLPSLIVRESTTAPP